MVLNRMRLWLAALVVSAIPVGVLPAADFDWVLAGGRVIDPESGLDDVRHVGIKDGQIVSVSATPLASDRSIVVDVSGLIVAPGFIDLHAHGQSAIANEYQVHDGVTTALELEWGYPRVAAWLESRRGKARINFGATVSHGMSRSMAVAPEARQEQMDEALRAASSSGLLLQAMESSIGASFYSAVEPERLPEVRGELERGLKEGALGIGMAHQYYPGARRLEIFEVFELAARRQAPIFTHIRSQGIGAVQEVVANAAATGAPLHIVHLNSSSLSELPEILRLIGGARQRGVDVSTEAYPYTAASTALESALFDEGWQQRLGISYGDIQWQETNERLTEESFRQYRQRGGVAIIHVMKANMIDLAMRTPFVMVASDGMPYAPGAHPRSAGTFSRVLGHYVRERGVLPLGMALTKMTLMPALRLESIAPGMARKGRVQEGMDADLTLFDPDTIIDTATFEEDLSFSRGVTHVLVNGQFVVRDGETVKNVFPGRAVVGRYLSP